MKIPPGAPWAVYLSRKDMAKIEAIIARGYITRGSNRALERKRRREISALKKLLALELRRLHWEAGERMPEVSELMPLPIEELLERVLIAEATLGPLKRLGLQGRA